MDRNKKAKEKIKEKSKEVRDAEIADFVNEQKHFRRVFLETTYKKNEVEELQLQINSGLIKVKWHGMDMPEKLAKSFFNLLVYNYREYAKEVAGLQAVLEKKGMTKKQITDLIKNDKYVSEIK